MTDLRYRVLNSRSILASFGVQNCCLGRVCLVFGLEPPEMKLESLWPL